jgi:hypothetical protein
MTLTLLLIINSCNTSTVATRLTPSRLERFPLLPSLFLTTQGDPKYPRLPETSEHPNPGVFLLLTDFLIYFLSLSLTGCHVVSFLQLFVWEYAACHPRWQVMLPWWQHDLMVLKILKFLTTVKYDMSWNPPLGLIGGAFGPMLGGFGRYATMWLSTGTSRVNHAAFLVSVKQRLPL